MECCSPTDPNRRRSNNLDKDIVVWMREYQSIIKFLLLGAGESGKTTIIKQMKILHIQGFSESERKEKADEIRRNVLEAIKEITISMITLKPPENLVDENNFRSLNFIEGISLIDGYDFPQEFYEHVMRLWSDPGVQRTYQRMNEFPLIDSAKYFLDKVHSIRKEDYLPTDQDILHCRKRTTEIQKVEFQVKVPKKYGGGIQNFWMFDVGGQRGERRKWIQVFDGITAVLFLVACSGFDMTLREDDSTNRLREALSIFHDVWRSRFLKESGFILFLNKQDLLQEKIERGANLGNYFQEFLTYTPNDPGVTTEYEKARCFIKDMFLRETKKCETPSTPNLANEDYYCEFRKSSKRRICYWHYTTATNTENVKRVFEDIHTMIIMQNLENIAPT